jgi:hypothetical protein
MDCIISYQNKECALHDLMSLIEIRNNHIQVDYYPPKKMFRQTHIFFSSLPVFTRCDIVAA